MAVAALVAIVCQAATLVRYPYLQNEGTDRVTIIWTTAEDGAGTVQYSTDRSFTLTAAATTRRFGTTETGLNAAYFQHTAQLTGLLPDTPYTYRVVLDGQVLTPGDECRTAGGNPYMFLAFGDSGQDGPEQAQLARLMLQERPALVLHTGDLAYPDGTYEQFQRTYFNYYRDLMKRVPFFPTIGNHEYHTAGAAPYLAVHSLPSEGVPTVDRGRYYSFDWGNTHFISLDTNAPFASALAGTGQMLNWLESDLQRTRQFWRIVYFHHPPYPTSRHENDLVSQQVRERIVPILDRYNVPLVLSGHEHNYQRSLPRRGGAIVEPGAGTVYVVTGGGGGELYPVSPRPGLAQAFALYHYLRIEVQGSRLALHAIARDGSVIDNETLQPPPLVASNAIVNAASFNTSLAPGGLVSIFGQHLAPAPGQARSLPLPTELSSTSVTLNGRRLPLLYAAGGQINAQLPFDVTGPATLRVTTPNGSTTDVALTIADMAPAIFPFAIVRLDGSFVSSAAPALPGEFVSVYMTGLGRVNGDIVAGQAAPDSPVLTTRTPVEVQISGFTVTPTFSGLAPGFVGLYQVNLEIPELDNGTYSLRVLARGVSSNAVILPVRAPAREPGPPEPGNP